MAIWVSNLLETFYQVLSEEEEWSDAVSVSENPNFSWVELFSKLDYPIFEPWPREYYITSIYHVPILSIVYLPLDWCAVHNK